VAGRAGVRPGRKCQHSSQCRSRSGCWQLPGLNRAGGCLLADASGFCNTCFVRIILVHC
jgi:hypothetical protein